MFCFEWIFDDAQVTKLAFIILISKLLVYILFIMTFIHYSIGHFAVSCIWYGYMIIFYYILHVFLIKHHVKNLNNRKIFIHNMIWISVKTSREVCITFVRIHSNRFTIGIIIFMNLYFYTHVLTIYTLYSNSLNVTATRIRITIMIQYLSKTLFLVINKTTVLQDR